MINDNLGSLFEGDPSAPKPMSLRQGVVEEWDSVTGDNSISVAGGVLVNVPVLTSESASLVVGDVVSLLTTDDRVLLLGKVTTPGDPGTVPTWIGDLTALAPLVPLAGVTTGLVMTGATNSSADSGSGARIVINDPAYPNRIAFFTENPAELEPAQIWPIGAGGSSLDLVGPKVSVPDAPATFSMSSNPSTGVSSFDLDADLIRLTGSDARITAVTSLRLGDGSDYIKLAGHTIDAETGPLALVGTGATTSNGVPVVTTTGTQTLTNKDLTDATNVFPATLTPRAVYKTADTTINNSSALATDPHLQIAGIAAGTYALDALVIYSSSSGAGANWKGFFTATGSITDRLLQVLREPLTGNEYGLTEGASTFTAAGNGVGVKRTMRIVGTFTATAGGQAFNLQWAQNTAEVSNTVVYKGSYYRIQKIA